MNKYLIKKTLVIGILILFIGAIFIPNISGNSSKMDNLNDIKNIYTNKAVKDEKKDAYPADATDWWPMWRHSSGNDASTTSIAPNTNQLNWKGKIPDEIYSAAPVIYDDKFYISTGWYYDSFGPPITTEEFLLESPDFSEVLNNLLSYKEEYFGGIYCLNADTGEYKWKYGLYAPNDPLIVDDKVYVTDLNTYSYYSSLYCLDSETGTLIWNKPVGALVTTPTIGADDKIFIGCLDLYSYYGALKCYDFDGVNSWTYNLPPNEFMWFSAPAYCDGKVYFIASDMYSYFNGKVYCLDAETGSFIWSRFISTFYIWQSSPVCKDGKVYAVDFNIYGYTSFLKCFNADTGADIWQYPLGYSFCFGTPAVTEDSAYIAALNIISYDSYLYRINKDTGYLVWKNLVPGYVYFFSSCSPSCSADKVFILPWTYYWYSDTLYCMSMENGNIIWSYNLDYYTIVYPSIADERVYVADAIGNVYAIEDLLKIGKISGGFLTVKAEIKNIGIPDFTDVSWEINVVGGMFDMIDKHASGDIATLKGGDSKTVRAFPIMGMGNIDIQVVVSMQGITPIRKNLEGIVLGLLVIIKS